MRVSAATLFYKFRPSTLTVHAKQVNKQRFILFNDRIKTNHWNYKTSFNFYVFKVCLGLKIMVETKKLDCLHNIIK